MTGRKVFGFRKAKSSWPPCSHPECPEPQGGRAVGPGAITPTRISGAAVGHDGVLCFDCYYCCRNEADMLARGWVSSKRTKWWGRKLGEGPTTRQLVLPGFRGLVA
jgi:hypothetical protein